MSDGANKYVSSSAGRLKRIVSRAAHVRGEQRQAPGHRTDYMDRRIRIKRAYEPASAQDGHRVLVDRMWPRGLSKQALRIDSWLKEVAPSTQLRKWFGHESRKWDAFRVRYGAELRRKPDEVDVLRELAREGKVTLVYAASDAQHNNAVALSEFLRKGAHCKKAATVKRSGARGAVSKSKKARDETIKEDNHGR